MKSAHLLAERTRVVRDANATLDRVRVASDLVLEVENADIHDLGVKDLLDLVTDQVVHRLHVKLLGEALLDAVDDRQLGSALVCLREQALGLTEQSGILEGDAQTRREGRQQAHVRFGERIRAVDVLERDVTAHLRACPHGCEDDRLRRLADGYLLHCAGFTRPCCRHR